jgi:hypothetical protein
VGGDLWGGGGGAGAIGGEGEGEDVDGVSGLRQGRGGVEGVGSDAAGAQAGELGGQQGNPHALAIGITGNQPIKKPQNAAKSPFWGRHLDAAGRAFADRN